MTPYDDNFPTCRKTYTALRIFSDTVRPEFITAKLRVDPSDSFSKGDQYGDGRFFRKFNGWFLSSENKIGSKDTRRHVDWLISEIANRENELKELRGMGVEIDVSCFWLSTGQGGPVIGPAQMKELSRLDLEIWWDVYFDNGESNGSNPA